MLDSIKKRLSKFWQAVPEPPIEEESFSWQKKFFYIVVILLLALTVRYFHYLDIAPLIPNGRQDFGGITAIHEDIANDILLKGKESIFPSEMPTKGDTHLLVYPPGYGLFLSSVYASIGRNPAYIEIIQALLAAISAVLIFFIALELFNRTIAFIAAFVVAISHHLAYYSVLLLPDAVVPVFIMAGTLLMIRACRIGWHKEKGYWEIVGAGIFYGLACWLRTDVLLIWTFWVLIFILLRNSFVNPLKRALLLAFVTMLMISPLTVRNYRLYGEFIPISIGSGIILQEGVAESDPSLKLPAKDAETMQWEAKTYNKPEYTQGLMTPDGIFRDSERTKRAMGIILSRPFWYTGVMFGRLDLMMKYSAHASLIRSELPNDQKDVLEGYRAKKGSFSGQVSYYLEKGSYLDLLRPLLRGLQRIFKEGLFVLLIVGLIVALKNYRSWLLLMIVPLYYFASHIVMHVEFRYVLPAHYLLFIFYSVGFYTIFIALPKIWLDRRRVPEYAGKISTQPFEQITAIVPTTQSNSWNEKLASYDPNTLTFDNKDPNSNNRDVRFTTNQPNLPHERISMCGVKVDVLTQQETLIVINRFLEIRYRGLMTVVNASKLVLADQDPELKRIIQKSQIVTADGMSVVWASKFLGTPLKERVTGIDTFIGLLDLANKKNYSVYFLGAKIEILEEMLKQLKIKYPNLKVAGYHDGYFGHSDDIVNEIQKAAPDILFVAMGSPRQEKWLYTNFENLNTTFALGVGGSFDHITGFAKRAPQWMQAIGLEWLHRLAQEPQRLWKRYLIGNTMFLFMILKEKLSKKF